MDADAHPFLPMESSVARQSVITLNMDSDWSEVQRINAGGLDTSCVPAVSTWEKGAILKKSFLSRKSPRVEDDPLFPFLPFMDDPNLLDGPAPAKPVLRTKDLEILPVMVNGKQFEDRQLPAPKVSLSPHPRFTPTYFVALGNIVAASGYDHQGFSYPADTPNFMGARIPLVHTALNIERWRHHLIGYEAAELVQFLQYGFPLGLREAPEIESCARNHGSSYQFFPFLDEFIAGEILKGGLTGPYEASPWPDTIYAPLMTAPKKPDSRRAVFDATFGNKSLNNSTPSDHYLGQPCTYTFPKINDFRELVLRCGPGSFLWKRDLSRYFLQLPLCPTEYRRVGIIWRGLTFFFIGLMFGLRHSGLQGQKVTDAVAWIHRQQGLDTAEQKSFHIVNYSDDLGGVESTLERAQRSFLGIADLLLDLGLKESKSKAIAPSTEMTYLGVMFNTKNMTMSVPPDKLTELKSIIDKWARRSTSTKKELQSLLGRLFWVAKVVRFSRVFMGRLLSQLRLMAGLKDNTKMKLSEECRKDLIWWSRFLRSFNGITMIRNEEAIPLSLDQLLDTPDTVCAGDATPTGIGAWHGRQYWSRKIPAKLLSLPIHLLEFWAVVVSSRIWADSWTGKVVQIFTDNDAVADVISHEKPRDPSMLSLLREFVFIVCEKKFTPVIRKIGTAENFLADHISRRFDQEAAKSLFSQHGLDDMVCITAPDKLFELSEPW